MARFSRKSQKIKKIKIFWKISDFLMNFQNLELIKNTENQQAQKMENLHVFRENSCTFSKAKRKIDFKKRIETRSLKMDLQKDGSSFEEVDLRLEILDLTQQKPSKLGINI